MIAIHLFIQQVTGVSVEVVGNHSKDKSSEVSDQLEQHAEVDQEVCKAKIQMQPSQILNSSPIKTILTCIYRWFYNLKRKKTSILVIFMSL